MEQSEESSKKPQSEAMTQDMVHDLSKDTEKPRFAGLYREDVVQGVSQPGVLGLVAKVAGDSDSDSSESEDEEDKGADDEALSQGFARICWANSEESTHKIEDIKVVDRSFMHGDIVAKVSSPMGQTGMVTNVDLKVDLQLPTGDIIAGVDSKTIRRVRPFVVGDYVIHDQWLGRVDEIYDNVTVMFEDGAKCKITCADPERLVPISLSPMDDSECPYYPGQRVKASFTGWLKGCWKPNRTEGTVINVEVDSVVIYWMAAASTGSTSETPGFPAERQTPNNLKRLMNFSHTTWQLGDRALSPQRYSRKGLFMPSTPSELDAQSDNEVEAVENTEQAHNSESLEVERSTSAGGKESVVDSWVAYRRKLRRRFTKHKKKALKKGDYYETALLIIGTKTRVDVLWQDGTREKGVDTCTLFPVDHVGDHDFWPEQHVMERVSDMDGFDIEVGRRAGIVKSVDSKQRTARVRWLLPTTHPQKWPSFEKDEVVSVYELVEHPDFDYCLGDVVIRLSPSVEPSNEATAVSATVNSVAEVEKESKEEQNMASQSSKNGADEIESNKNVTEETELNGKAAAEANVADLSWVGIITAIEDGQIEVAWADGEVSKVGSQAIFVVGRDEDDGSSQASAVEMDEEVDDAGSWTTVDSTDMHDVEGEQELGDGSETGVSEGLKEGSETDGLMREASGALKGRDRANISLGSQGSPMTGSGSEKGLGSALSLPFTALIRALKFAASLLWALRGSKRLLDSDQDISNAQSESSEYGRVVSVGESETGTMGHVLEDASIVQPVRDHSPFTPDNGTISGVSPAGEAQSGGAVASILSTDVGNDDLGLEVGSNEGVQESCSPPTIPATDRNLQASNIGFFKQFDSVKDTTDHHFKNEASQPSNQRRWSKKIQQEWAMLERCLPDTIFVRVYEDRMDLMRSVIVGASGTPYHDGLFFFDLYLPAEYPSSPPHVHYHSGGLRLNPNLYETGKVCLSLLNTWTGKGNEIWHSSSSSILQVLVSIQGLVLNANPYFNEAGYDKQMGTAEGEKNSLAYVENSFLLSCKSMLYLIRRPPTHFQEFVKEHFKKRGPFILRACLAYMQGAPVGSLTEDGIISAASGKDMEQSTVGFRLMLVKIIPRLIAAFKEVGACCDAYEQQLTAIKG